MTALSEKGVQSLDFTVRAMHLPHPFLRGPMHRSIFACRALKHLSLNCCVLPAAPEHFAGFPNLLTLSLDSTAFHKARDLEALISMSPKLEEIKLSVVDVDSRELRDDERKVRLVSSSLRFLQVDGIGYIQLVGVHLPRMLQANFLQASYPSAVQTFFPGWLLHLRHSSITIMASLPSLPTELLKGLPSSYKNLKRLKVHLNFNYPPPILSTLNFLRTAPCLTQLVIQDVTNDLYVQSPYPWVMGLYGNLCPSLCFLQMSCVTPQPNELDFIRLILSKARMLQVMEVKIRRKHRGIEIEDEICGFDKVSPCVQIHFKNY